MKVIKSAVLTIAVGLLIVFALGLVFLYLTPVGKFLLLMRADAKKGRQSTMRLLSETDHEALLSACRELLREVSAGNLQPFRYQVRYEADLEALHFPRVILDIEPLYVDIGDSGRVFVEMNGALHHCGVTAYSEDYERPSPHFVYGDKKIIDGLWYYEHGYNPEHDKWVEKQLQKGRARQ